MDTHVLANVEYLRENELHRHAKNKYWAGADLSNASVLEALKSYWLRVYSNSKRHWNTLELRND